MVSITAWLLRLGLGQYEQAFRNNDIDASLLPTLTDDDLRELGVVSLGHRKQILAATAELDRSANAPPMVASAIPQAERRQLTVLFVDLVGSTALLRRGAEDISEAAPLVAPLLGIETGSRYLPSDLTLQQRRAVPRRR
ncbi:SAM domain-containing protein [Ensifer aridi]|uniref:SAM domain-containing protein n=1 Tax=Ensifer aridi TaxID=1708715 RepID=UPI00040C49AA|nr:SAM domain-containing protein [Ensifer aridi]